MTQETGVTWRALSLREGPFIGKEAVLKGVGYLERG